MTKRTKRLLALMAAKPKLRRVSGLPPLTYWAKKAGTLTDYRIYGQTVDGESVGDRTGNLWGINGTIAFSNDVSVKSKDGEFIIQSNGINGAISAKSPQYQNKFKLHLTAGTYTYSYRYNGMSVGIVMGVYTIEDELLNSNFTLLNDTDIYIGFYIPPNTTCNQRWMFMLNSGSTPLPYEPYGYKVPVTVEGKNLLQNAGSSRTITGVTFTVNDDGSVTCNGQATANTFFTIGSYYSQSTVIINGCPKNGASATYSLKIQKENDTTQIAYDIGNGTNSLVITERIAVVIRIASGYVCNNLTFYPMIRKADIEDDTYEPYHAPVTTPIYLPEQIKKVGDEAEYIDYGQQKQHRVRKNLLQNTATSQTINGVTFTVNADGSVTCNTNENGASGNTFLVLRRNLNLNNGRYIFSGCPSGGGNSSYLIKVENSNNVLQGVCNGSPIALNLTTDRYIFQIRIASGYICNNLTFYPMIRKADVTDDTYEPYIENTELDVTLPALPTVAGTNTLTVGTEVQPSLVEVTGRIRPVPTGGGE